MQTYWHLTKIKFIVRKKNMAGICTLLLVVFDKSISDLDFAKTGNRSIRLHTMGLENHLNQFFQLLTITSMK